jgi:hypothetical protein
LIGRCRVDLQLKKLLVFTGGSEDCVRADRSSAIGDVTFLLS